MYLKKILFIKKSIPEEYRYINISSRYSTVEDMNIHLSECIKRYNVTPLLNLGVPILERYTMGNWLTSKKGLDNIFSSYLKLKKMCKSKRGVGLINSQYVSMLIYDIEKLIDEVYKNLG